MLSSPQLDTRELFRAVAPAMRRCCSADVAALSLLRCGGARACGITSATRPTTFPRCPMCRMPTQSTLDGSASGYVFRTGQPRIFSLAESRAVSRKRFILARGIQSACCGAAGDGARHSRHAQPRGVCRGRVLGGPVPAADARGRPDRDRRAQRLLLPAHRGTERAAGAREAVSRRRDPQRSSVRGDHRPQPGARPRAAGDRDGGAHRFDGADPR